MRRSFITCSISVLKKDGKREEEKRERESEREGETDIQVDRQTERQRRETEIWGNEVRKRQKNGSSKRNKGWLVTVVSFGSCKLGITDKLLRGISSTFSSQTLSQNLSQHLGQNFN